MKAMPHAPWRGNSAIVQSFHPSARAKSRGDYDRVLYRQRNHVERFFRRLKRFRRIATRYDKLDSVFLAFIHLAVIYDALQLT